jgi:hypothetical protein
MPYRLRASLSDNLVTPLTAFRRKVLRGARKATASRVYRSRRAFAGCLPEEVERGGLISISAQITMCSYKGKPVIPAQAGIQHLWFSL